MASPQILVKATFLHVVDDDGSERHRRCASAPPVPARSGTAGAFEVLTCKRMAEYAAHLTERFSEEFHEGAEWAPSLAFFPNDDPFAPRRGRDAESKWVVVAEKRAPSSDSTICDEWALPTSTSTTVTNIDQVELVETNTDLRQKIVGHKDREVVPSHAPVTPPLSTPTPPPAQRPRNHPGNNPTFDYTYRSYDVLASLKSLQQQFVERENNVYQVGDVPRGCAGTRMANKISGTGFARQHTDPGIGQPNPRSCTWSGDFALDFDFESRMLAFSGEDEGMTKLERRRQRQRINKKSARQGRH